MYKIWEKRDKPVEISRDNILEGIALCFELEKVWSEGNNAGPRRNRQQRAKDLRVLLTALLVVDASEVERILQESGE